MTFATNAILQINRATNLEDLTALGGIVTGALDAQIAAAAAQGALVAPLAALSTASLSTLPTVVSFLQALQTNVLVPQAASAAVLSALGTTAGADKAAVLAAIAVAEARISG